MNTNEMLFTVLVVLNLLDVYTTLTVLRQGGSEVNPVMNWLMDKIGVIPALIIPKTAGLLAFWFVLNAMHPLVLVVAVCVYLWVVWNNFGQIRK